MFWILSLIVLTIFLTLDIFAGARLFLGRRYCRENWGFILFFAFLVCAVFNVFVFFIGYTFVPHIFL